jgi:hypothetical protein
MIDFIVYPLVILAAFLYVISRLFIPVEVFLSIRSLPIEAFNTVDWAALWPHV